MTNTRGRSAVLARIVLVVAAFAATTLVGSAPAAAHTPHDVIGDVSMSPEFAEDGTAYTVVRAYLLQTTDGGETWNRLHRGIDTPAVLAAVEVDRTDPDRVYLGTRGGGIYRSTDAGGSWSPASDGLGGRTNIISLVASPEGDAVFGITNQGEVVSSADGADTWSVVDGLAGVHVMSMAFAPEKPTTVFAGGHGTVHRSDDGGATWRRTELEVGDDPVTAVVVSPRFADDDTVYAGTSENGVRRSDDGGRTFAESSDGLEDRRVRSMVVEVGADADSDHVWASTWDDGAYRSDDGGESWERHDEGLTKDTMADDLDEPHFTALAASAPPEDGRSTLFLSGFDGLFRSTDGDAWEEVTTQDSTNIGSLAVSPDHGADGTLAVTTYINGAFRSDDRGETWTPINAGLTSQVEYLKQEDYFSRLTTIGFEPTFGEDDDERMFAGSRGYLFLSDDRGELWTPTRPEGLVDPNDFPPDYLIPATTSAGDGGDVRYFGTDSGMVFRSVEGGPLYKTANLDVEILALAVVPSEDAGGALMAATVDGVYLGGGRGDKWLQVPGSPEGILSLAVSPGFATDQTAYVGTESGLFVSTDRGSTWSAVQGQPFGDEPVVEAVAISPAFEDDGTVLVSARGRGLFRSTDGGATFAAAGEDLLDRNIVLGNFYHPTTEPIVFSPDYAEDRTVYGYSGPTLFRSSDGGDSWKALEIPRVTHPLTRESAPNDLLLTPRAGDDGSIVAGTGAVTESSRVAEDNTVLIFTAKRVLAAIAVAVIGVAVLWAVKFGSRSSARRLAIYLRLALGGLIFAVALFVIASR